MDFFDHLRDARKSASTIAEYARRLALFEAFINSRKKQLIQATTEDVMEFQAHILRLGNSERTVNAKMSTIRQYFAWLLMTGEIHENPVPQGISLRARVKRVRRLTDDELIQLLAWVDTLRPNARAAFLAMYGSGARVGEIAHLKYSDIFVKNNSIWLNIVGAKWGSDRVIPIVDENAARAVWEYRQDQMNDGSPLFHVAIRTLQGYASEFSDLTGIYFHPHLLRHTFAARLLEDGVSLSEIQFLLGHRDVSVTAHYTESAIINTRHLAASIYQTRGTGGELGEKLPRLRPPEKEE